jgi:zinc transport system substrate-binding protein
MFLVFTLLYSFVFAKPGVVVSILPEKTFVQKIAKDLVDVTVMVEPGTSPHSYEPKSTQMIALSKADIYFSIGVGFEDVWLDRFKSQNSNLKFIDISSGIAKLPMGEHLHEGHNAPDPHTWTSPSNVVIMAHTIFKALSALDPSNKQFYKANLEEFIKEIKETDAQIKNALKELEPKSKFMVFHPTWGYFAHEYDLVQLAVEVEGKKPKPKEMITVIEEARRENVKAIFTQPEFSDKSAQVIARELNIPVIKISPLSEQWAKNLIFMAKSIANK